MNKIKKIIYIFLSILIFFSMANFSKANVNINIPSNFAYLEKTEKIKVLKKAIIQIQARIQEILSRVSASSNQEINFESILIKYKENINRNVEISSFYDLKNSITYYGEEEKDNSSSKLYVKKDAKNDKISAVNYREWEDEYRKEEGQINFIFDDNKIFWIEKGKEPFFGMPYLKRDSYKKNQWFLLNLDESVYDDDLRCNDDMRPILFLPPLLKFLLDEKEFMNSIDKIILNNKKYNIFKTKLTGKKENIDGVDAYEVNISFSDNKEDIKKFIIGLTEEKEISETEILVDYMFSGWFDMVKKRNYVINFIDSPFFDIIKKRIDVFEFKIWVSEESELVRTRYYTKIKGEVSRWVALSIFYHYDKAIQKEAAEELKVIDSSEWEEYYTVNKPMFEIEYVVDWKYTNKDFDIKFPKNNNVVNWLDITNCHESVGVVPKIPDILN